jgi:alkanesulfonate monooxygenase SsuD/methylene tetrahydromethanopterin reductase-like flavin-dependent oxidoreductase (luciferase family)
MDVGIGLPSTIPWSRARLVMDWAQAAEQAGFSTVATLDRLVYGNLDAIPALAAAAAVTSRIRLTTAIMIGPFRGNGALLAKQLATVDRLSEGRLTVGIAVGARPDDFEATASPYQTRGKAFDAQLAEMRAVWAGEPRGYAGAIGPAPVQPGGPPLLIGGGSPAAFRRMTEYGAGWILGAGGPDAFAAGADKARSVWREAGREGQPRLVAIGYVSLGDDADEQARRYLGDYYSFSGPYAERIIANALTTHQAVADAVAGFTAAGCEELILFPANPDLDQITLIATATGLT